MFYFHSRVWSRNTHPAERYWSQDMVLLHWCQCTWLTHFAHLREMSLSRVSRLPFVRVGQNWGHTIGKYHNLVWRIFIFKMKLLKNCTYFMIAEPLIWSVGSCPASPPAARSLPPLSMYLGSCGLHTDIPYTGWLRKNATTLIVNFTNIVDETDFFFFFFFFFL